MFTSFKHGNANIIVDFLHVYCAQQHINRSCLNGNWVSKETERERIGAMNEKKQMLRIGFLSRDQTKRKLLKTTIWISSLTFATQSRKIQLDFYRWLQNLGTKCTIQAESLHMVFFPIFSLCLNKLQSAQLNDFLPADARTSGINICMRIIFNFERS